MRSTAFLLTRPLRDVTTVFSPMYPSTVISTHTPLAGRDIQHLGAAAHIILFLLTRPLRDVTYLLQINKRYFRFLLTRPLRDVTRNGRHRHEYFRFLLTRPLRDVTDRFPDRSDIVCISTHTPLAGRDMCLRNLLLQ